MKGVILAGGDGTRISGHHNKPSKVLIEVDGVPLICSNMERIAPFVTEFIVVVGKARDAIVKAVGNIFQGIPVTFVTQEVRDGPLGALRCAMNILEDDDIILVLGDEYLIGDMIPKAVEIFNRRYPVALLGVIPDSSESDIAQTYSVKYRDFGKVVEVVEKPTEFPNKDRGTGYYFLSKAILDYIQFVEPRPNGQYELADLFNFWISSQGSDGIRTTRIAERAYNINTVETLNELIH